MASVRRDLCQDTDPRALSQQSSGNRDPRVIHLNELARTSVCRRRRPTPHSHQPVQRLEERNRLHLMHRRNVPRVGVTAARAESPLGVVTMSVHKLTAGSGYDYLTRQVAALDATEKGHIGLASYYTERGESPGVWIGSGMDGIDGLTAGDPVTAEQMRALFGCGHASVGRRSGWSSWRDRDLTDATSRRRPGWGRRSRSSTPTSARSGSRWRGASPRSTARPACRRTGRSAGRRPGPGADRGGPGVLPGRAWPASRSMPGSWPGQIAKESRPRTQTVAGYDLTFSPVKSVSTLWAVADPAVAAQIERAHQAAVKDALAFIEQHALFTRTGPQGIRQVNVRGLVAAAFTHRDSRAGDPDLHTHVAVANKVQTLDGRWLSIDGRVLFKATVAASETYNTALEHHLRDRLGVRFAERPDTDPRKRPVREIVGVDPATEPALVDAAGLDQGPGKVSWRPSFSAIMAGRRRRSRRCSWRSRPPWRPGRPSTNPAGWPSNAPPGTPRPPKYSADPTRSRP